ncbi:MAG: protein translocase subunit SecF [bacterium]
MLRIFKNTHFDFVGKKKIAYIFSLVIFVISTLFLLLFWNKRQGIDFTGGTIVRLSIQQGDISTAELRSTIQEMGGGRSIIQESRGEYNRKGFIIRLPLHQQQNGISEQVTPDQQEIDSGLVSFFDDFSTTENIYGIYQRADSGLTINQLADTNAMTVKGWLVHEQDTLYLMAGLVLDSLIGLQQVEMSGYYQVVPPVLPLNMVESSLDSAGFSSYLLFVDIDQPERAVRALLLDSEWDAREAELTPVVDQQEIAQSIDMVIKDQLEQNYSGLIVDIEGSEHVGARISQSLKWRALWVVTLGIIAILAYISIRFTYRFGIAAIVALIHDLLITAGIYAISGFEFNISTIAGLLTIVGYSINDSIVVSDRIREVNKLNKGKDFLTIVNMSINATLGRTIITSATTLAVLFSLFIFGSSIIKDFAFVLMIGVFVGTYSSIFVVSPIVVDWERKFPTPVGKSRA